MQTTKANPVAALSNLTAAVKPAPAAPAVAFQQVLNREVTGRQPTPMPQNAGPKTEPTREPAKQGGARTAEAKNDGKAGKTGAKSTEKTTDAAKEEDGTAEPADQASNELLALVANLNQAPVQAETEIKTDGKDTAADAAGAALSGVPQQALGMNGLGSAADARQAGEQRASGKANAAVKPAADGEQLVAAEHKPQGRPVADTTLAARHSGESKADAGAGFDAHAAKAQDALQALASKAAADKAPVLTDLVSAPIQQAAALSQAAAATDKLSPRVGTPAWDNALGQKIVWMVGGAEQSASLSLNPPDLGPLQVVLNVTNDQADATFIAAQPEVRQAIEAAMPKLREMMSEAGIQLGQANVNAQAQGQQQAGGEAPRQSPQRTGNHSGGQEADAAPAVTRSQRVSSGLGVVDTFA